MQDKQVKTSNLALAGQMSSRQRMMRFIILILKTNRGQQDDNCWSWILLFDFVLFILRMFVFDCIHENE